MADLVKLAATAKRLVEANGRAVAAFKVNRDPDAPAEPWRGTSTTAAPGDGGLQIPNVLMAFVPATGGGFGKLLANGAGSLVVAFDQVGLLASASLPAGATPANVEECDALRDGDDLWKIVTRGHLRPATTSLLFVLGLKK